MVGTDLSVLLRQLFILFFFLFFLFVAVGAGLFWIVVKLSPNSVKLLHDKTNKCMCVNFFSRTTPMKKKPCPVVAGHEPKALAHHRRHMASGDAATSTCAATQSATWHRAVKISGP